MTVKDILNGLIQLKNEGECVSQTQVLDGAIGMARAVLALSGDYEQKPDNEQRPDDKQKYWICFYSPESKCMFYMDDNTVTWSSHHPKMFRAKYDLISALEKVNMLNNDGHNLRHYIEPATE